MVSDRKKQVPVVGQVTPQQVGPHRWQPDTGGIVLRGEKARHVWKNLVSFGAEKKPTLVGG